MTSDGKQYAPFRYQELVKERYVITKRLHTSYEEAGNMTPTERKLILGYITDEIKQEHEAIKNHKNKKGR